jgi:hypothetical protein
MLFMSTIVGRKFTNIPNPLKAVFIFFAERALSHRGDNSWLLRNKGE